MSQQVNGAAAWSALYSLHYLGEWTTYDLSPPAALDSAFRPSTSASAAQNLTTYTGDLAPELRRLAVAEVCRGSDSPSLARDAHRLIDILTAAEQPSVGTLRALHELLSVPKRAVRFERALEIFTMGCSPEDWDVDATFCKNSLLGDVTVSATAAKPSTELAGQTDPRLWSKNFPLIWQQSHPIDALLPFADRGDDPPEVPRSGDRWQSPFFERLGWSAIPGATAYKLSDIRNVLYVEYEGTPTASKLVYRNVACLSLSLPLLPPVTYQGGVDVDFGEGSIGPLPSDAAKTRIVARKASRFSEPRNALRAMNESSFINTLTLLQLMVLGAACGATSAARRRRQVPTLSFSIDQSTESTEPQVLALSDAEEVRTVTATDLDGLKGAAIPADRVLFTTRRSEPGSLYVALADLAGVVGPNGRGFPAGTYSGQINAGQTVVAKLVVNLVEVDC